MISPTSRPCTVMLASHSGQFVIASVPPSGSFQLVRHTKSALRPSLREGRRALTTALVIPPSFGAVSRQHPRRVQTYSCPLTGASGQGLLSHHAISSRCSGLYSRPVILRAFHHLLALWRSPRTVTRPIIAVVLFGCSLDAYTQGKDP